MFDAFLHVAVPDSLGALSRTRLIAAWVRCNGALILSTPCREARIEKLDVNGDPPHSVTAREQCGA
jgi:hypothetical protein